MFRSLALSGGAGVGLTISDTGLETFVFCFKAVSVAATATIPEWRACTDGGVIEPVLDKVSTLSTRV